MTESHITFTPQDLKANKEGKFSDSQVADFKEDWQSMALVAGTLFVGGVVILGYTATQGNFPIGIVLGIISIVAGALVSFRAIRKFQLLTQNAIEGLVGVIELNDPESPRKLTIDNQQFRIQDYQKKWFTEGQAYRVFFMHGQKEILTFEAVE